MNPGQNCYVVVDKTPKMECSVCQNRLSQEKGVHCPACARALIYNARTELAKVLLEKEELRRKVEAIVGPEPDPSNPLDEETAAMRRAWQAQCARDETQQTRERTEEIERVLAEKQKELEEKKAKAQAMREHLAQKRANLAAAKEALAKGEKKKYEELREAYNKLKVQHEAVHAKVVESKEVLCRKAADLLKLQHIKKKTKAGTIKDCYSIAGLLLPDLREINSKSSSSSQLQLH